MSNNGAAPLKTLDGRPISELAKMSQQAVADGKVWFPSTSTSPAFTALAMAGEVGELCNIIKKVERGSLKYSDPMVRHDIAMESTDVFTYFLMLAGQMSFDPQKTYDLKRAENIRRFAKEVSNG
jgi:NTP pyrophosphatase (non-canonical NTP hydrolase)